MKTTIRLAGAAYRESIKALSNFVCDNPTMVKDAIKEIKDIQETLLQEQEAIKETYKKEIDYCRRRIFPNK